jgi:hypothetical protein
VGRVLVTYAAAAITPFVDKLPCLERYVSPIVIINIIIIIIEVVVVHLKSGCSLSLLSVVDSDVIGEPASEVTGPVINPGAFVD